MEIDPFAAALPTASIISGLARMCASRAIERSGKAPELKLIEEKALLPT
jgi:hypothetical protein